MILEAELTQALAGTIQAAKHPLAKAEIQAGII